MSELDQFQAEVNEWGKATFPHATAKSIATHLYREAKELLDDPDDPMEAADVFILVLQLCGWHGASLMEVARVKMEINYKRTWGKPDADGVVEHLPAARLEAEGEGL